ncbi:MAG: hypothetical protein MJ172_05465 [Clostridia bacterium]|nr:hypothetical protein [Clostridia bacterium]
MSDIDNKLQSINIEDVMSEIRNDIKEKYSDSDLTTFDDVLGDSDFSFLSYAYSDISLQRSVEYVVSHREVQVNYPITGNPIKVFYKKLCRRLMAFYVNHLFAIQNDINYHMANSVFQLYGYKNKLNSKGDFLKRLESIEQENDYLKTRISELEAKLNK